MFVELLFTVNVVWCGEHAAAGPLTTVSGRKPGAFFLGIMRLTLEQGSGHDHAGYVGFVCSRSRAFLTALVESVGGKVGSAEDGAVGLQTIDNDGRNDVEIRWPGVFHGVFEAKRGFALPTQAQLMKYVPRLQQSDAKTKALVAVTNATKVDADNMLKPEKAGGIRVQHIAWREIRALVRETIPDENNANKLRLREFDAYLTEIVGMENARSNMVYVVSLGGGGAWGLSFREVVDEARSVLLPHEGALAARPAEYVVSSGRSSASAVSTALKKSSNEISMGGVQSSARIRMVSSRSASGGRTSGA